MAARLLSAAVGIPILTGAVWLGGAWLAALVAVAAATAYVELHRLLAAKDTSPSLVLGLLFTLALALNGQFEGRYALAVLAVGLLSSLAWQAACGVRTGGVTAWAASMAGPLYIGVPLGFALLLRAQDGGRDWLLLVLLVTFAADTAAYLVGRPLGKHRMAPTISPKKTWEGAAGGLVGAVGVSVLASAVLATSLAWWQALALGLVLGIVAQAGDLAESALKRALNAGDASRLIPGHGGVLDRLDSIVFTLVVMYHIVLWVNR